MTYYFMNYAIIFMEFTKFENIYGMTESLLYSQNEQRFYFRFVLETVIYESACVIHFWCVLKNLRFLLYYTVIDCVTVNTSSCIFLKFNVVCLFLFLNLWIFVPVWDSLRFYLRTSDFCCITCDGLNNWDYKFL